jgi:hypothetical protein
MIKKSSYQIECGSDGEFEVFAADGKMMFLKSKDIPFLPVTTKAVIWGEAEVSVSDDSIIYNLPDNNLYDAPKVVLQLHDNYIEFYFKAEVKRRMALNKWYLFPSDSEINALECLDFRSHIDSPSAYKVHQTVLGRRKLGNVGLDANTEDGDLMFAPHPMLFVFRHLENSMVIAPMELVAGESCHVRMIKGSTIIDDYHIEIGRNLYWLEPGEELESPHFMINLTKGKDVYETLTAYTDILVESGRVQRKKEEDVPAWAFSPMWCSWGDQHTILDSAEVIHLAVSAEARANACDNITEQMVEHVVGVIEKHELPVRTLILDDKWYTHQGDMNVDTDKFPDFRGMIDNLHDKGFKVMAWASLYQFEYTSEAYKNHPDWFILHHFSRNKKNPLKDLPCLDYSDPEIVEAYMGELMDRLLSDKPGCYNLDGIKFDWPFLLPHDYPFEDRNWIGKEKTIYNIQKIVYDYAKRAKKDSLIIGVSPHPFFNDTQDIIRTYDVSTFDTTIHIERAKYIKAIAPGMVPALDEHVFYQNFFSYMEQASELGIPMIYNLLRFNGDGHVYTEDDYKKLKVILDNYVTGHPRLKEYYDGK